MMSSKFSLTLFHFKEKFYPFKEKSDIERKRDLSFWKTRRP